MRKTIDQSVVLLCGIATALILVMLTIILVNIAWHGTERLSWSFLSEAPKNGMTEGGIFPAIYGTVLLVLLMSLAAVPFGVVVAIYFAEYARRESWFYRTTRMAVNNLAGVPSIVFGLFGLGFFVLGVGKTLDSTLYGGKLVFGQPAIIWGAATMAVLTLPVVIITVEETLRAVPREYREASLALGATRLQTIVRVVLPQSWSGVMTGAILAVSRGAGEWPRCSLQELPISCRACRLIRTINSCSSAITSGCSQRSPPMSRRRDHCCMRQFLFCWC
jgi:phosphate transport system permease protein